VAGTRTVQGPMNLTVNSLVLGTVPGTRRPDVVALPRGIYLVPPLVPVGNGTGRSRTEIAVALALHTGVLGVSTIAWH
jgi:hypothetical protein